MTRLALVTQRAARYFAECNGRLSWRACYQRAALAIALESRS